MKYFTNKKGEYIGAFDSESTPPKGAIEIEPPAPGQVFIDGKWQNKNDSYVDLRADEYPFIGDQLDAIWKILNQWRLEGKELPQDGDNMLNAILAVKKKHPKPE